MRLVIQIEASPGSCAECIGLAAPGPNEFDHHQRYDWLSHIIAEHGHTLNIAIMALLEQPDLG